MTGGTLAADEALQLPDSAQDTEHSMLLYHRISSDTTTTPPQNNSTSDVAAAAFAYVHAGRARSGHRFHAAPVLLRARRLPPRIRLSRVVRNVGAAPSYS